MNNSNVGKGQKIINLIKKIIHLLRVKLVLTELSIKNKHRLMKISHKSMFSHDMC